MLKQCIEVFKSIPENEREKLVADTYIPADGTYILVSPKDDSFEIVDSVNIKNIKKTGEIQGKSTKNYITFCQLDYNSKLIDMNKPIDGKKVIHSNNYLSFFIKKESLTNGKLTNEIIDNYYSLLSNPKKKYEKNKGKDVYLNIEKEIGPVNIVVLEKIKKWIVDNIFNLDNSLIEGKDYLKIFFDYPLNDYKREGIRYFIPNIYNSNDYNFNIGNKILGLPNDNMGMNSKKPYLDNKSRGMNLPYVLDNEEVLIQKKFFDYLMNLVSSGKCNVIINNDEQKIHGYKKGELPKRDCEGVFLYLLKGKNEAEIHECDYINGFKVNLKKEFNLKNYINLNLEDKNVSEQNYRKIISVKDFQAVLNEVFFGKCLINNYFTEGKDLNISDSCLKSNLLLSRNSIFNFIFKGVNNNVFEILDKVSLSLVKGAIFNGFFVSASHKFNLRLSIIEYKGGIDVAEILNKTINSVKEKINADNYIGIENDEEYYFSVGQIVSYLLSKYKGKNKPLSLAAPFINAKTNEVLKENLRKLYKKYTYDPTCNNKRFKNYYVLVTGYEPDGKVNEDMIIAGFLSSNLIFNKEDK
ncbi:MAG: type I-B CRISPR-associated protein Cas8b/Csh1 [Clostridium sp.]|nr:type I-B CRISPR-associated protein Cas8b/Csh1 [Clostridium sp.]